MRTTKALGALVNELRSAYIGSDIAPSIDLARTPERQGQARQMCLDEAARWRRQAQHLRDQASQPHPPPDVRAGLLCNARICDNKAEYWEAGARECVP